MQDVQLSRQVRDLPIVHQGGDQQSSVPIMASSGGLYCDLSQTDCGEVTSAYSSKVKWVLVNTTEYSWIMITLIDRIKLPQHQRIASVINTSTPSIA
jgi:hypothetical protein